MRYGGAAIADRPAPSRAVPRTARQLLRNALETSWAENDVRQMCASDGDQAADLRR
jgi:hypothetical protein